MGEVVGIPLIAHLYQPPQVKLQGILLHISPRFFVNRSGISPNQVGVVGNLNNVMVMVKKQERM